MFSGITQTNYAQSPFNLFTQFAPGNPLGAKPSVEQRSRSDFFDLSSTSSKRSKTLELFSPLTGYGSGRDTKTLAEVGEDLAEDLSGISSSFGTLFRAAGIDNSKEIRLKPDLKGSISVQNEHPDAGRINQLIKSGSPMTPRIMVALARASLLNTAETSPAFAADYKTDPRKAIRTHIDSLREMFESSSLSIQQGRATPVFG